MPNPFDNLLVFELGTDRWCCGWAHESGPDQMVAAPPPGARASIREAKLKAVFSALDATPSECAVLVAEPPGTTAAARRTT